MFRAIADPGRRRLLDAMRAGERSVGELTAVLGTSQPAVSQQLAVLRAAGLVADRPAGRRRLYRLEPGRLAEVDAWLDHYRGFWTRKLGALEAHLDRRAGRAATDDDPEPGPAKEEP